MTFTELTERAKKTLNAGEAQPRVWPENEIELASCVMLARQRVARNVMGDAALCGLLQQEYSVTLDANGRGDLLAAVGSVTGVAGEILIDGVRYGAVLDAEGQRLHPLKHYHDFLAPQNTAYGYYVIKDGATILTRARDQQVNTSFDIQSATGPLMITANYTPADVDSFPVELEDRLVQALVDIVSIKVTPANADAKVN